MIEMAIKRTVAEATVLLLVDKEKKMSSKYKMRNRKTNDHLRKQQEV